MSKHDKLWVFITVFILVTITRLPFITAGYGLDPDAWWVANTAKDIATTGEYHASRLPGYPIHEIVSSLLWRTGPVGLNGVTAILSGLGVAFFAVVAKSLGDKRYLASSVTLAFTPVVYSSSTVAMDYMWAFAFIMCSFYLLLVNRQPVLAGLMLGVAVGCRITSVLMLVPFVAIYLLHNRESSQSLSHSLRFVVASLLAGASAFAPVFIKYGWSFLSFVETNRNVLQIIRIATTGVFGRIGAVAAMVGVIVSIRELIARKRRVLGTVFAGYVLGIAVYLIVYLRLPVEAAYLIPAIPFGLLLMDGVLPERVYVTVCAGIVLSSFVSVDSHGITDGRIIAEHKERLFRMEVVEMMLDEAGGLPEDSVVVAGDWYPMIDNDLFSRPKHVRFVYSLGEKRTKKYLGQGYTLHYLPGQRYLIRIPSEYEVQGQIVPLVFDSLDEIR